MRTITDFLTQFRQRPTRLLLLPLVLAGLYVLPGTVQRGIGQVFSGIKNVEQQVSYWLWIH